MNKLLVLFGCVFFWLSCRTQKKAVYDFPPAMAANIQAEFTKICDKGKILYDKNCARCHNVKVKGKMIIPDFSEEKLVGYTIRVSNRKHEANMPDSLVSEEELGLISTFLSYKAKSNVPQ